MRSLSLTEIGSLSQSLKIRLLPDKTHWLINILMLPQGPGSWWPKCVSEMNSWPRREARDLCLFAVLFRYGGHTLVCVKQQAGREGTLIYNNGPLPISVVYILPIRPISDDHSEVGEYRVWKEELSLADISRLQDIKDDQRSQMEDCLWLASV